MKKLAVLLLTLMLCGGCVGMREVNNGLFATSMAIDLTEGGRYVLTLEISDLSSDKNQNERSFLSVEAGSPLEALDLLASKTKHGLFWDHIGVIIINRRLAERGLLPTALSLVRDNRLRLTTRVVVSGLTDAAEIYKKQPTVSSPLGMEIAGMIDASPAVSGGNTELFRLLNRLTEGEQAVLIPVVGSADGEHLALSGLSVFGGGAYTGELDYSLSPFCALLSGRAEGLTLTIPTGNGGTAACRLTGGGAKISVVSVEPLRVSVAVSVRGMVYDNGHPGLISDIKWYIEERCEWLLSFDRTELRSDLAGVGRLLAETRPGFWERENGDWLSSVYPGAEIALKTDIRVEPVKEYIYKD